MHTSVENLKKMNLKNILMFLLVFILSANTVKANKDPKKKPAKAVLKRSYIDSVRVNTIAKTIATETEKRRYHIEKKDTAINKIQQGSKELALVNKYAEKMKVPYAAITNVELYQFIDSWYGTRYVYGGTTRRGIDCSAFVRELYKNVYGTDILRTSLLQYSTVRKIRDKSELQEGDMLFFNTLGRGVSHVGVYLKNGYFIHSSSSRGVAISSLSNGYWKSKYISGGRLKS